MGRLVRYHLVNSNSRSGVSYVAFIGIVIKSEQLENRLHLKEAMVAYFKNHPTGGNCGNIRVVGLWA
jgi:hypothetical protein